MKVLLLILMFICCGLALDRDLMDRQWMAFIQKYKKKFVDIVHQNKRKNQYKKKIKNIEKHNQNEGKTYTMVENFFTDMELDEIKKLHMGLTLEQNVNTQSFNVAPNSSEPNIIASYSTFRDWRQAGAITPVKNQGSCGSCWAFTTVGALEAYYFLKNNVSIDLSEQDLVNCVQSGCKGGWMNRAFDYVTYNGIKNESMSPYTSSDNACVSIEGIVKCNGYEIIRSGDEQHMKEVVDTKGPVAVAIAVNENFMSYGNGVYVDSLCPTSVNHGVLVVGYGTENGTDYWLVKNSWGPEWGDQGYIKMARNNNNQCAIASYGSYPLL